MRLDPENLRDEANAHQARQQSPLWSDDGGKRGEDWTAKLNPQPQPPAQPSDEETPRQRAARPQPQTWASFLTEDEETAAAPPRERETHPDLAAQEIRQDARPSHIDLIDVSSPF